MKVTLRTDSGTHISLSRRNLEQLLEALDHGNEGPQLSKRSAYDAGDHYLVIVAQENENHYTESE
jgi:hypothetical protein